MKVSSIPPTGYVIFSPLLLPVKKDSSRAARSLFHYCLSANALPNRTDGSLPYYGAIERELSNETKSA